MKQHSRMFLIYKQRFFCFGVQISTVLGTSSLRSERANQPSMTCCRIWYSFLTGVNWNSAVSIELSSGPMQSKTPLQLHFFFLYFYFYHLFFSLIQCFICMCVYMCVPCVCVYIHICLCVCIYIHTHKHIMHTYTHIHIYLLLSSHFAYLTVFGVSFSQAAGS